MLPEQVCSKCLSYMIDDKLKGWLKCLACSFMKKKEKSMITLEEILMNRITFEELSDELKGNINKLHAAVNKFRTEYGKPMYVSSGYRDPGTNANIGGSKKSAHMTCQAVDFKDNGELFEFIKNDPTILERCGLYMEDPTFTPTWVHLQIRPASKRIFLPYSDGREPSAPNRNIEKK